MAVKVADGVPGMLSSTAGTLPPKLPPLPMATSATMATIGSR